MADFHFDAIGTTWHITTIMPLSKAQQHDIQKRIEDFDCTYSRFRDDSLITKIAQKKGTYSLPSDAKPLFAFYETLYTLTLGCVTPLIGQLLSDAGYDSTYSLTSKPLSPVPKWEDVLQYDFPHLTVTKPILLDFGAAGKGYLLDIVGKVLQDFGIASFCINAGGDILYQNNEGKKLRVGLEHPSDTSKVIGVAQIAHGSICGSAGNRRKWGNVHHIMHPQKKIPVSHILSTWVIAQSGLIADGLATALFFADPGNLAKAFSFQYVILHKDYSLITSPNFPAEFY